MTIAKHVVADDYAHVRIDTVKDTWSFTESASIKSHLYMDDTSALLIAGNKNHVFFDGYIDHSGGGISITGAGNTVEIGPNAVISNGVYTASNEKMDLVQRGRTYDGIWGSDLNGHVINYGSIFDCVWSAGVDDTFIQKSGNVSDEIFGSTGVSGSTGNDTLITNDGAVLLSEYASEGLIPSGQMIATPCRRTWKL